MKTLNDYIEHARLFDRMAREATDSKLKAELERQADAYRKLAIARAKKFGLHWAPDDKKSNSKDH